MSSATPKRVSARLELRAEDVASAAGVANFESRAPHQSHDGAVGGA